MTLRLPATIYRSLETAARSQRRSVNKQAIVWLEQSAHRAGLALGPEATEEGQ